MRRFDVVRAKYFFYCLIKRSGFNHAKFIKKHNCFEAIGDHCFYQPFYLPADSKLIRFGNNVVVASDVKFICHDVIHHVFNNLPDTQGIQTYWNVIDIKDNCFIGSESTILAGVTIGPNAVIAAGSLVNKDVPEGVVVGGVPARVIGTFENLKEKRKIYSDSEIANMKRSNQIIALWKKADGR